MINTDESKANIAVECTRLEAIMIFDGLLEKAKKLDFHPKHMFISVINDAGLLFDEYWLDRDVVCNDDGTYSYVLPDETTMIIHKLPERFFTIPFMLDKYGNYLTLFSKCIDRW